VSGVLFQIFQFVLTAALAPLVTGVVRKIKARLNGRIGASPLQPYRDLWRLLRKQPTSAATASPVFFASPAVAFVALWLASGLVPTFTTDLALAPTADLIALVALLAAARFATALGGLDVGTAFGGIGASRDMMIAALAEPAMLMVIFTLSLVAGSTALTRIVGFILGGGVGIEISLSLALIALLMVAIAENGRIPIDNPATHLELTMVHEAMVLEYSGRHLALVEAGQMVKLLLYLSLVGAVFLPWGIAVTPTPDGLMVGLVGYLAKLAVGAAALGLFEVTIAKMRVFRVTEFLGGALLLALLATIFRLIAETIG
jgi:formate hydrogenlyase subunit 4